MRGLTMKGADMKECRFNGTKTTEMVLQDSSLESCGFNGTSVSQLRVTDNSEVVGLKLNGSKVNEMEIRASKLEDVKIKAAALKKVVIARSAISRFRFESNDLVRVKVTRRGIEGDAIQSDELGRFYLDFNSMRTNRALLEDVSFDQMRISDCSFTNCKLINVSLSGFEMKDMNIIDLHIRDCQITSLDQLSNMIAESEKIEQAS